MGVIDVCVTVGGCHSGCVTVGVCHSGCVTVSVSVGVCVSGCVTVGGCHSGCVCHSGWVSQWVWLMSVLQWVGVTVGVLQWVWLMSVCYSVCVPQWRERERDEAMCVCHRGYG